MAATCVGLQASLSHGSSSKVQGEPSLIWESLRVLTLPLIASERDELTLNVL